MATVNETRHMILLSDQLSTEKNTGFTMLPVFLATKLKHLAQAFRR